MTKPSDCYQTPQDLYDELNIIYHFLIDACTNGHNSKAEYHLSDALEDWENQVESIAYEYAHDNQIKDKDLAWKSVTQHAIFMNPPYSNPGPFLERAWEFSQHMIVVCLVRADPSTKWYQKLIDLNGRDNEEVFFPRDGETQYMPGRFTALTILNLPKRLRFEASEEMLQQDADKYINDRIIGNYGCSSMTDTQLAETYPDTILETKNFRRTKDGRIECKGVYNFPCCLMIMDRTD